jgi:hypothetical protein
MFIILIYFSCNVVMYKIISAFLNYCIIRLVMVPFIIYLFSLTHTPIVLRINKTVIMFKIIVFSNYDLRFSRR